MGIGTNALDSRGAGRRSSWSAPCWQGPFPPPRPCGPQEWVVDGRRWRAGADHGVEDNIVRNMRDRMWALGRPPGALGVGGRPMAAGCPGA